jgi:hypothetical protein
MRLDPPIPANAYHDGFGNFCHVIRSPAGRLSMSADFLVHDNGEPDEIAPQAMQHALEDLPVEVLIYLLGRDRSSFEYGVVLFRPARYCTGYLGDIGVPPVGRRFVTVSESKNQAEAEYRYVLTRLREHGESIAVLGGEAEERSAVDRSLTTVLRRWREILGQTIRTTRTHSSRWVGEALS